MSDGKPVDPIPEAFSSYEEAAAFWDTHDTTEYPDAMRTVEVDAELRGRHYEIEIDADIVDVLKRQAQEQGVPLRHLANEFLRKQISARE